MHSYDEFNDRQVDRGAVMTAEMWVTTPQGRRERMTTHWFDCNDTELGYWSHHLSDLTGGHEFDTPRIWGEPHLSARSNPRVARRLLPPTTAQEALEDATPVCPAHTPAEGQLVRWSYPEGTKGDIRVFEGVVLDHHVSVQDTVLGKCGVSVRIKRMRVYHPLAPEHGRDSLVNPRDSVTYVECTTLHRPKDALKLATTEWWEEQ